MSGRIFDRGGSAAARILRRLTASFLCGLTFVLFPLSAVHAGGASYGFETKETALTGKSILFTGGSITEAYCERNNERRDLRYGWASRIGERNQMKWITVAKGGASISDCRGDNTILNQLKRKQEYSYDFVVLQGGVNDAWDAVPLGKLSTGTDPASFDMSTFAGGLETTIQFAKATFPDALVCYVITFQMPLATGGHISDMSAYVQLTKDACDKWGVPYLDMYHNKELNDALEVGTSTRYLSDHVHPTSEAYDILSPVVEDWLLALASGETADPAESSEPASSSEKGFEQKETALTGKRILFTGDSICEAICERQNGRRDIMYGWASRIGEYNQMTWITTGYGGASVSNCRGENTILRQLRLKQNSSYDIVVLHGGVNDAWDKAPFGRITDSFDPEDFDLSTFAGGLEATIQFAKSCFPDAIMGYIINFRLPLATQGSLSNMNTYVKITQKVCQKWGVEYLDLYNDKELNAALEVGTSTKYLPDHIHPNTGGYDILYPVIESWLIDLVSAPKPGESSDKEESTDPSGSESSLQEPSEPNVSESGADSPFNPSVLVAVLSSVAILAAAAVIVIVLKKRRKT